MDVHGETGLEKSGAEHSAGATLAHGVYIDARAGRVRWSGVDEGFPVFLASAAKFSGKERVTDGQTGDAEIRAVSYPIENVGE